MYLKQVQMENFKSFNGKMKVEFLNGFTAITGPNGSGKSNISDAILFVLGPRSSRAIRAGKLTDLIFNGGNGKKASKYTKVSLTFSNDDRLIPVESDSVTLTRLVKRSQSNEDGYNSYFYVNGRKSSLSEFSTLLSRARMSSDGYNFVQQGDVTNIVQMGAVERRRILESIAGIDRYDVEIKHAEKKRAEVEENIDRTNIIMDELKHQLKDLDHDRTVALKYRDYQDDMDLAKAQLVYKRKDELERLIESHKENIVTYESKITEIRTKREELKNEEQDKTQKLTELERKIGSKGSSEAKELQTKMEGLKLKKARSEDKIEDLDDENKALKIEKTRLQEELKTLEKKMKSLEETKSQAKSKLEACRANLETHRKEQDGLDEEISSTSGKGNKVREEMADLQKQMDEAFQKLGDAKIEWDRISAETERLEKELLGLEEQKRTHDSELKDIDWELGELNKRSKGSSSSLKTLQEDFYKKKAEEKKLYAQKETLEATITRLTREYTRLKAESDAARDIAQGFTKAVAALREARTKNQIKGIHGTIAELAKVDEKYETALNVAAGGRMQAVVVDDDGVASECIKYLKKNKLGRATFLPLNKMMDGRPRGKSIMVSRDDDAVGFAIDLIDFDDRYRTAFWYVLRDTLIMGNLESARANMGGVRMVTLEGELLEPSGAMVGGSLLKGRSLKFGAPSQTEISKVAEELGKATEHAEKAGDKLKELGGEVRELEEKLKDASQAGDSSNFRITELKNKKKEFKGKLDSCNGEIEEKSGKLIELEKNLKDQVDKISSLQGTLKDMKEAQEEKGKKLLQATPKALADKMKSLQSTVQELVAEEARLAGECNTSDVKIKMMCERKTELSDGIKGADQTMRENKDKIDGLKEELKTITLEMTGLAKISDSMDKEMQTLQKSKDELYKDIVQLQGRMGEMKTKVQTNEDLIIQIQGKVKELEATLSTARQELESYPGHEFDLSKLPSTDELNSQIKMLEGKMKAMEPVNMRAIEDYDSKDKRYKELKEQLTQLKKERDGLIKLVDEMDKKKVIGLNKVLVGINEQFIQVYEELSTGGQANLQLENPESPFEGGLIIWAQPPEKKVQRVEALSGGEKSLVSLAFIFAIQQYDPSPFYVLDEVDQNLDAVNAENISKMIKNNAANAQFLVVSLRKVTLKEADHLYGVTMLKSGVSNLIGTVNVGEVQAPAAAELVRP